MSRITTPIIMGLVFYIVITPMAVIKKFFGSDAISREFYEGAQEILACANYPGNGFAGRADRCVAGISGCAVLVE
jgi:hypothetical protein